MAARTGREVRFDGRIRPSLFPLGIKAGKISIANAAWSQTPTMIQADSLAVGVELMPLLSGEIRVRGVGEVRGGAGEGAVGRRGGNGEGERGVFGIRCGQGDGSNGGVLVGCERLGGGDRGVVDRVDGDRVVACAVPPLPSEIA